MYQSQVVVLVLCIWFICANVSVSTSLHEIQTDLAKSRDKNDDIYASLVKYDKALTHALKIVQEEVPPNSISWGKLGIMYYERDQTWRQGGTEEALIGVRMAKQLALMQQKIYRDDYNDIESMEHSDKKGFEEERKRRLESLGNGIQSTTFEAYSWLLQEGIILNTMGKGTDAVESLEQALELLKDLKPFTKQTPEPSDPAGDEIDANIDLSMLQDSSLRATVYHYLGDVHLRLLHAPKVASRYLRLSLELDPCGAESGEGRIKLVHATIASIKEQDKEEQQYQTSNIQALAATEEKRQKIYIREWRSHATQFEADLVGIGAHNSDVPETQYKEPLIDRCNKAKEGGGEIRWKPGQSVVDASGQGQGPAELEILTPQKAQPSTQTLLRWALYQVYDQMQMHTSIAAAAIANTPNPSSTLAKFRNAATEQRSLAWGYLSQAHEDEVWLRYRYNAQSPNADTPAKPNTDRVLEGVSQKDYKQKYSLAHSVSSVAALKKTFGRDYWPPADIHTKQIGYSKQEGNSESLWEQPIFIVGFFRSGSSLLERILTTHSKIDSIGEDSVLGMELRALEMDMMRIVEKGKKQDRERLASGDEEEDGGKGEGEDVEFQDLDADAEQEKYVKPDLGGIFMAPVGEESRTEESVAAIRKRANSIMRKMHSRVTGGMAWVGPQPPLDKKAPLRINTENIRVIDKMLNNHRSLGLIHLLFPNATILHMVRDPMDTLHSCYRNRFTDDNSVYTLETESLVVEYKLYLETMAHWKKVLPPMHDDSSITPDAGKDKEKGKSRGKGLPRIMDIQYRDLVVEPRKTLKKVFERLQLPWEEEVMKYYEVPASAEATSTAKPASRDNDNDDNDDTEEYDDEEEKQKKNTLASRPPPRTVSYLQVQQPLYTSSIGAWTRYARHLQPLAKELSSVLEELHYKHKALPLFDVPSTGVVIDDVLNWRLNPNFDYATQREPGGVERMKKNAKATRRKEKEKAEKMSV